MSNKNAEIRCIWQRCIPALEEFLKAPSYADGSNVDLWQYALEIAEIRSAGLSRNDLRWLVQQGHLEHGLEKASPQSDRREFERTSTLRFDHESCFVLTQIGHDFAQQVYQGCAPDDGCQKPTWDEEYRELTLGKLLVKRYRCPAQNQETILGAFEEEGWPPKIDDPLPQLSQKDPKRRLHDAIKSLNKNQHNRIIQFCGDGTGEGVIWELTPSFGRRLDSRMQVKSR